MTCSVSRYHDGDKSLGCSVSSVCSQGFIRLLEHFQCVYHIFRDITLDGAQAGGVGFDVFLHVDQAS